MNAPLPLHAFLNTDSPAVDADPQETAEWREAFVALAASQGPARARFLLGELARLAGEQRIGWKPELATPYVNTVDVNEQQRLHDRLWTVERTFTSALQGRG